MLLTVRSSTTLHDRSHSLVYSLCVVCVGLESEIDIQRTVEEARMQRTGMVQTEDQYKFIYTAVQHYVENQKARLVTRVDNVFLTHNALKHRKKNK